MMMMVTITITFNQSESNFSGIEDGMTLAMISGINQKYIHYF